MTALTAALAALAYAGAALLAARAAYRRIRPWTEPVACRVPDMHGEGHQRYCHRRFWLEPSPYQVTCGSGGGSWLLDTRDGAAAIAAVAGLAWPLIAAAAIACRVALAVRRAVTAGDAELPAEREARTARLEAENERLRREQEGAP